MFKKIEKNEKGFTLVELVVVIAILAILAVLLVPKIMGNVDEARASRHTANARTIASEISTKNALSARTGSGGGAPTLLIGAGVYDNSNVAGNTILDHLDRTVDDFPDPSYAQVVVDSQGNASVVVHHKYSY
ncbi:MAG: prepilin-type N-terminal cleavage/methylation domain-containing protein [Bacillota bacterium]|nr:prepilin-type N-terminal cleavage/methylation domain-containing protein [Bacillota bacterium]